MNNRALLVLAALAGLAAAGCDKKSDAPAPAAPAAAPAATGAPAAAVNPALLSPETAKAQAPGLFRVKLETTKGDIVIEVRRDWAPNGADRFYNMVKVGYLDGNAFFRVVDGFMAQVGIHGDPAVNMKWHNANIPDDLRNPAVSNTRGMVTFATAGPGTRTTQFFMNFKDNSFLDPQGFPPFGKIVEGDGVLDQLYRGYGDGPPNGNGVDQGRMTMQGNAYLKSDFPNLDYVKTARLLP